MELNILKSILEKNKKEIVKKRVSNYNFDALNKRYYVDFVANNRLEYVKETIEKRNLAPMVYCTASEKKEIIKERKIILSFMEDLI